jgi:hypothetical protein
MYHIYPKDGEHPRKAMALMYPEYHDELMGKNSLREVAITNYIAKLLLSDLKELYGVDTDYYTIQSLLCEYKQSCLAGKQYPGKSVDTMLAYHSKVYEYWGEDEAQESELWQIRKNIFPSYVLGEVQGWNGVRNELGKVLLDHGYTWNDRDYDYVATTDFSNPVRRSNAVH